MDFDPDRDPAVLPPEEAQKLLESRLTEADQAEVREVFRDISSQIRWGRVLESFWAGLLERAECLAFAEGPYSQPGREGKGVYRDYPWTLVDDGIRERFEETLGETEDSRSLSKRHLLTLYLSRKILGGLRTKVRQGIENIPILPEEAELRLIDQALQTQGDTSEDTTEEVSEGWGLKDLAYLSCLQGGHRHPRTRSTRRLDGDLYYLETYCLDCHQTVSRQVIGDRYLTQKAQDRRIKQILNSRKPSSQLETTPEPETCLHRKARWVKGKEGQEACCSHCGATIENPARFHWLEAGLEPFGDDPEKDEAIVLCSDYS